MRTKVVTRHYSMKPRIAEMVDIYSEVVYKTKSGFVVEAIVRYVKDIKKGKV